MPFVDTLIKRGSKLFSDRLGLLNFWQESANNFYLERADFTRAFYLGENFADGLTSSYPLIVRRELGGAISSMLRPADQPWFETTIDNEANLDLAGRAWLQGAANTQRKAMYDRVTQFVRATKEGDHDFATFGQNVLSHEVTPDHVLYFRTWHLRDCAWRESAYGKVNELHRNWNPTLGELVGYFKGREGFTLHTGLQSKVGKEDDLVVKCRHVQLPIDSYQGDKSWRTAYVSVFVDIENNHIMYEVGSHNPLYTVPRWQTVSGSQYAFSPAVVCGLADARVIQAMSLALLDAGESATRPPLIAQHEVVKGGMKLHPGGVTFVDREYDERLGEAVRPLVQDRSGIPFGLEMMHDSRDMLSSAFYLNKLTPMPRADRDMTAYEVAQHVQDYIRGALPLFEPMEMDYNGQMCEAVFGIMMTEGAFGPYDEIPRSVRGNLVRFKFESPLHRAIEKQKGMVFVQSKELITEAAQLDKNSMLVMDAPKALRESLQGIGTPAGWLREDKQVQQLMADQAAQAQAEQALANVSSGADALERVGKAQQVLKAA